MPEYSFQRVGSDDYKDFFFAMKDVPSVGSEVEIEGAKWKRVFTAPRAAIDTAADPYSSTDFNKKFANKKGITLGDTFDEAKALSDRRAAKEGKDPIREKYFEKYKKEHHGQEHPHQKREKFERAQRELGINISLNR